MTRLLAAAALSMALTACSNLTEPTKVAVVGCHVLATSRLSNGAPARSALVRITPHDVQVIGDVAEATTAGYDRGTWRLEDGELQLIFGGGFIGVTYTFTQWNRRAWSGEVEFWVDTPVLNGSGTAIMSPTRCPLSQRSVSSKSLTRQVKPGSTSPPSSDASADRSDSLPSAR